MRIFSVFLLSVSYVSHVLAAKLAYPGIVMTSIDVKYIDENSNPKRVEFSGRIKGNEEDTDAIILKNIVQVRMEGNSPIFQADEVSVRELKASIKKPLLCIHGFNVQPEDHLATCKEARGKFKNFDLLPVIWPSTGGLTQYFGDRGASKGAGVAFTKDLEKYAGMFPRKSLLAHSMGNRVLRFSANEKFKFDNIFMVAADVNNKMFDEDYINTKKRNPEEDMRREDGLKLAKMLRHSNSKIYVLHNWQDFALTGSSAVKLGTGRLGASGVPDMNKVHPDIKGKIKNINAGRKWLNWSLDFAAHSYQFIDKAIDFYDEQHI
jgi:esterase/lipase superfamily enzyme